MKTVQNSPLDTSKDVRKKSGNHMEKDFKAVARHSQEILQHNEKGNEDSDDEADDYFSDMDETNSINNAPSGLMSLLGKSNLR